MKAVTTLAKMNAAKAARPQGPYKKNPEQGSRASHPRIHPVYKWRLSPPERHEIDHNFKEQQELVEVIARLRGRGAVRSNQSAG